MVYDQALNKLAYTESQLKRAIRDVYDRHAEGVQVNVDQAMVGPDNVLVTSSVAGSQIRRQMSGPRERPQVTRRRFVSTLCEFCTDREREIGMAEDTPKVGTCAHGIEDVIISEDEDGFLEEWPGTLLYVEKEKYSPVSS